MPSEIRIDLIYDQDCPNVGTARSTIRAALLELSAKFTWHEWDREGVDTPDAMRGFGSPTVLVNGFEVGGDDDVSSPRDVNSCRVYRDERGQLIGAPSVASIVNAVRQATGRAEQ